MDTTIPHMEYFELLNHNMSVWLPSTPHPNGSYPTQNHKGDLWIYFASRLYDEERREKRFNLLGCKPLFLLLTHWNDAHEYIFPIHQQVDYLLRFFGLMIMLELLRIDR